MCGRRPLKFSVLLLLFRRKPFRLICGAVVRAPRCVTGATSVRTPSAARTLASRLGRARKRSRRRNRRKPNRKGSGSSLPRTSMRMAAAAAAVRQFAASAPEVGSSRRRRRPQTRVGLEKELPLAGWAASIERKDARHPHDPGGPSIAAASVPLYLLC